MITADDPLDTAEHATDCRCESCRFTRPHEDGYALGLAEKPLGDPRDAPLDDLGTLAFEAGYERGRSDAALRRVLDELRTAYDRIRNELPVGESLAEDQLIPNLLGAASDFHDTILLLDWARDTPALVKALEAARPQLERMHAATTRMAADARNLHEHLERIADNDDPDAPAVVTTGNSTNSTSAE